MKTPALLMLSALVALGHWLLLAPGLTTLAQTAWIAPDTRAADAPGTRPALRAMQTRRIQPALRAEPPTARSVTVKPTASATLPAPEPTAPVAVDVAVPNPSSEPELGAVSSAEPVTLPPAEIALAYPPAAPLSAPVQLPKAVRLNYDITGQSRGLSYRASGVLDWQHDDKHYDARMVASVFLLGSRTLSSQGEVTADGLAPTRFADKSRSEHAAHFQPDKGKITFSANTPDAPWQRGAQDRLSVFFQLAGMLAGEPERLPPGTHIAVYTAGARSADVWTFVVDGNDDLKLPAGDIAAIKLTRPSRLDYDQTVELWFAPALSYWPVRIKVTQRNGDFVDQQLASVPAP